jgi:streptothricin acetyltransferase
MIKISKLQPEQLDEYSEISIEFTVSSRYEVRFLDNGLSGIDITKKPEAVPYKKNYDDLERPTAWREKWNIDRWGIFGARNTEGKLVGGMVVAHDTPGLHMLEGRNDLAVLWDIRVAPDQRGKGIGASLFERAVDFSKKRKCKLLKIETQNNNVIACQFYQNRGCYLGGIHPMIYKEFPDEVQFLWYKRIGD